LELTYHLFKSFPSAQSPTETEKNRFPHNIKRCY
jgi:hypothetical protein